MKTFLFLSLSPALAVAGLINSDLGLYNTGVDGSRSKLTTNGTPDSHWVVNENPDTTFVNDYWSYAEKSDANWIWKDDTATTDEGEFTFSITFDLTGYDPNQTILTGEWGTYNEGDIYLNDVYTGNSLSGVTLANFQDPLATFSLKTGFNATSNTLSIVLKNSTSTQYSEAGRGALLVRFDEIQTMAVPEPSALLGLLTAGSLGLLLLRRRC